MGAGQWTGRNFHGFDICIQVDFCLFENSLNLLPQAEKWSLGAGEKDSPLRWAVMKNMTV